MKQKKHASEQHFKQKIIYPEDVETYFAIFISLIVEKGQNVNLFSKISKAF